MRRFLIGVFFILCSASFVEAQTSVGDRGQVQTTTGQAVAGATITVCTYNSTYYNSSGAYTGGVPCISPLTTYLDPGLNFPLSPILSDGQGNYFFYVTSTPPNEYTITISAPGRIQPYGFSRILGGGSGGGGGTPAGSNGDIQTNASGSFGSGVVGLANVGKVGNIAVKPATTDGVQYSSVNGVSSSDGRSAGTANAYVMNAYDNSGSSGGYENILNGSNSGGPPCTSTTGQGIWLLNTPDPGFASPPSGWRIGKPFAFLAASASSEAPNGVSGADADISCGSGTDTTKPCIWINDVSGVEFSHINCNFATTTARIGIDSTGSRNNAQNFVNNISLDHMFMANFGNNASYGPALDIGSGVLWGHFSNIEATGNPTAVAGTAQRACVNIDAGTGPASGLLRFDNIDCIGAGGFRILNNGTSGGSAWISHAGVEGHTGTNDPVIDLQEGSGSGAFRLCANDIWGVSDAVTENPMSVRNTFLANPDDTCLFGYQGVVEGPMELMFGSIDQILTPAPLFSVNGVPMAWTSPGAKMETGEVGDRLLFQADSFRRSFAPSLARFTNNLQGSTQLGGTWVTVTGTGVAITTGIAAPDGTTNASEGSCTGNGSGGYCSIDVYSQAGVTEAVGHYKYVGAWVQQASTNGIYDQPGYGAAVALRFDFANGPGWQIIAGNSRPSVAGVAPSANLGVNPLPQTDGDWQWVWMLAKIITPAASASEALALQFSATQPMNFFAPMVVDISPAQAQALISACTVTSSTETGNTVNWVTSGNCAVSVGEPITSTGVSPSGYNFGGPTSVVTSVTNLTHFASYNPTGSLGAGTGGTITPANDSEVAAWALNANSYSDLCVAGTICGLRGEIIAAPAFQTISANPAAAGVLRLANTDTINWRNAANNADIAFGINTNNQFVIPSAGGMLFAGLTGGGVQCMQVSNTGVVSATGSGCAGGGGGSSIFTQWQFGSNTALASTGLYIQLTAPAIFSLTQSGSGTSGSPYIDTFGFANAAAGTLFGNNGLTSATPSFSVAPVLGVPASLNGTLGLANGAGSGAIATIQNLGATSAYNFNLPTTAGTMNYLLTSGGGGSTSETWTSNITSINGTNCSLGGSCIPIQFQTKSSNNSTNTGLNLISSTTNTIGIQLTPSNTTGNTVQYEATGTCLPVGGCTGLSLPTAHSLLVTEGSSNFNLVTSPSVAGYYGCGFNVTSTSPVDPTCSLQGISVVATTSASPPALTAAADTTFRTYSNGSATALTGPPLANNIVFNADNIGAGTVTYTPASGNVNGNATQLIPSGWFGFEYTDNTNSWLPTMPTTAAFPNCGANCALNFSTSTDVIGTITSVVTGPASSTANDVATFNGTGGLTIQDGGPLPATLANVSHKWLNSYTASSGLFTQTQPAISDLTATFSSPLSLSTNTLSCPTCATTTNGGAISFDKSATGLINPTADATFTYISTSATGMTLAGTAPASVSTSTGTAATTLFNVNGVAGGATSNATGTAGVGSSPTIAGGTGGAGTGTNAVGGAGGAVNIRAGNGGASNGTGVNSNGGNISLIPGSAGTGGSGTAGSAGAVTVGSSPPSCGAYSACFGTGGIQSVAYGTTSNCSSSASPAVCGSAPAGSVALPTNAVSSSIVVDTTAVTANSQIFVMTDDTLGTKLSVTCNSTVATLVGGLTISARTAGTSFTVANNVAVVTNPLCVSYWIVN